MRNSEQDPALFATIHAHKPCLNDARGCVDHSNIFFNDLRQQIKTFTLVIETHCNSHEYQDKIEEIISKLSPEIQQELAYLIGSAQKNIIETDRLLPKPLQQHQPEVKPKIS